MVLQNYVKLEEGVPAVMHFTAHRIEQRNIVDPLLRQEKLTNALVFDVDRLAGVEVHAQFSTLSEKLASALEPWLKERLYLNYTFVITQHGKGFATEYQIQTFPFTGASTPDGRPT